MHLKPTSVDTPNGTLLANQCLKIPESAARGRRGPSMVRSNDWLATQLPEYARVHTPGVKFKSCQTRTNEVLSCQLSQGAIRETLPHKAAFQPQSQEAHWHDMNHTHTTHSYLTETPGTANKQRLKRSLQLTRDHDQSSRHTPTHHFHQLWLLT